MDAGCEPSGRRPTVDHVSHGPEMRRVHMEESHNEVIEIPARGHCRRVRRTPRKAAAVSEIVAGSVNCSSEQPADEAQRQLNAMDDYPRDRISEEEYREKMRPWGGARSLEDAVRGLGEGEGEEPDELDLPDESPEQVTDDDIFSERDFQTIEEAFPADNNPLWEIEETIEVEEEEAP